LFGSQLNTHFAINGFTSQRSFAKKNDNESDAEEEPTKVTPAKKTRKSAKAVKEEKDSEVEVPKPKVMRKRRTKFEIQAEKLEKEMMQQMEVEKAANVNIADHETVAASEPIIPSTPKKSASKKAKKVTLDN